MRYTKKYSVGLTGGIGSGKSTVTSFFKELGIEVIDADEISRNITKKEGLGTLEISKHFHNEKVVVDGELNRVKLREIIFNDKEKKQKLENILHPIIRQTMTLQASRLNSDYIVFDIPLLIETKQTLYFDCIICINTPLNKRSEWIKARALNNNEHMTEQQILKIINSQASDSDREEVADYLILNNGTKKELFVKVQNIHQSILADIGTSN